LLDAAPAIPLHAFAAMSTFVLGMVQFAAPKGTLPPLHHRLDLGFADGDGGRQFVLDPPAPTARALEPDPPAVDLGAVVLPLAVWRARTLRGRGSPPRHDPALHRRAGGRRPVQAASRAGSCTRSCSAPSSRSQSVISGLIFRAGTGLCRGLSRGRFQGHRRECRRPRKSLEKRGEKPASGVR
jgi:hypothetical protein